MPRDHVNWPKAIFESLNECKISEVAYVPDAGHAQLIDLCLESDSMVMIPLTSEEEGIAFLCGAWLGGKRGVLLLQSSGVGNCVNMFSLARTCRLPLLMLVTMRGEYGEFNPWQIPMGQLTPKVLEASGTIVYDVQNASDLGPTVSAAARIVFEGPVQAAVLIGQSVIGAKSFGR